MSLMPSLINLTNLEILEEPYLYFNQQETKLQHAFLGSLSQLPSLRRLSVTLQTPDIVVSLRSSSLQSLHLTLAWQRDILGSLAIAFSHLPALETVELELYPRNELDLDSPPPFRLRYLSLPLALQYGSAVSWFQNAFPHTHFRRENEWESTWDASD